MAAIRIPEQATPLLPFCRSSNSNYVHIWETFADLVAFLSAYGYTQECAPPEAVVAAKSTNPIDLSTFRNRGLYPQLLMIAIADTRNWLVSKSPDEICAKIEKYAALGAAIIGIHLSEETSTAVVRERLLEITKIHPVQKTTRVLSSPYKGS